MDWSSSYTAKWRVYRVNRDTWADAEALSKVDSVNLSRTADGSLLESAGMELSGEFNSDYYRIVMIAEQGGEVERVDVATLLFDVSGGRVDRGNTSYSVEGFSVLYPASVTAVTIGEYAPAGVNCAEYARELLEKSINAPVEAEGSFTLNDHIVHELGATVLSAVWSVLDAGNFVIQIDGRGVVHIMPKPTDPALVLSDDNQGLLMNGVDFSDNMSEIPNRYVVADDNMITIAENNNAQSPVSTVARGYSVDIIDTAPTLINGETYAEYADRMLRQSTVLKDERSYKREYAPDVYPYSIVRGSIDGVQGDLLVQSQTINCGNGITVDERAAREVSLW